MNFKKICFSTVSCGKQIVNDLAEMPWKYAGKKSFNNSYIYNLFFAFLSLLLFNSTISFAQVKPADPDQIQQQLLENAAENSSEDADLTEMIELRAYYATHPLDVNSATYEELTRSGLLNELQIQALMEHISKHGKLLSREELQTIDGFDLISIRDIALYIDVKTESALLRKGFSNIIKDGTHTFLIRTLQVLEEQKGFSPKETPDDVRYMGSPLKLYTRYRFNYGTQISFGVTGEKDAGEEFFKGSQKQGFDFYSAHFFMREKNIKALAIGDYQLKYGQGLVIWSGLATGKTADVINIKRNNIGIRPYASVNEFSYLRGGAVSYAVKKFTFDFFYSYRKLDASTTPTDTLTDELLITSFSEDGFHRTQTELDKKDKIKNTLYGGHINYRITNFEIGITAFHSRYNNSIERKELPYNQYDPSGNEFNNVGVNYNYNFRNLLFFGETARSGNNAYATINGFLLALDPRASLSVLYRNYSRKYQCIYCNSFRESDNANEKGIYLGLALTPTKGLSWNSYVDFFQFPWLRYQVDGPSTGNEWLTQVTWTPTRTSTFYIRYKEQQKQENQNGERRIDNLVIAKQSNVRVNASYKISPSFTMQSRIEFNTRKTENIPVDNGIVLFQDIQYNKMGSPFAITLRYVNFDTESYDTRIYAYESDIPGIFSIPSYYYTGRRFYLMVKYHFTKGIDFWVRYGTTVYDHRDEVGSGYDVIDGNRKSDLKMQLRVSF